MKLEDLTGVVEYDVLPPDHPKHRVAQATIISRVRFPRPEDSTYPRPYRSAHNAETGFVISVTQEALDNGTTRPLR